MYIEALLRKRHLTEQCSVKRLRSENEDEYKFWLQEVWYSDFRPSLRAHVICNFES